MVEKTYQKSYNYPISPNITIPRLLFKQCFAIDYNQRPNFTQIQSQWNHFLSLSQIHYGFIFLPLNTDQFNENFTAKFIIHHHKITQQLNPIYIFPREIYYMEANQFK